MKRFLEKMLAWAISGVFLTGLYCIGHFVLKMDNNAMLILAGWLTWQDMATTISKEDAKA